MEYFVELLIMFYNFFEEYKMEEEFFLIFVTIMFILTTVFLLIIFFILSKNLKEKESEINVLTKKISTLSSKSEQREAFRVDILMEECVFDVVKIGKTSLDNNKGNKGKVRDLSFSGMKLISDVDLPAREHVLLSLKIIVRDEQFELLGVIKRKEEYDLRSKIIYGIEFKNVDQTHKTALYQLLNAIEVERKKKQIEN
jgi:c-di-GMP-binding flagellar brake protein YcgR